MLQVVLLPLGCALSRCLWDIDIGATVASAVSVSSSTFSFPSLEQPSGAVHIKPLDPTSATYKPLVHRLTRRVHNRLRATSPTPDQR